MWKTRPLPKYDCLYFSRYGCILSPRGYRRSSFWAAYSSSTSWRPETASSELIAWTCWCGDGRWDSIFHASRWAVSWRRWCCFSWGALATVPKFWYWDYAGWSFYRSSTVHRRGTWLCCQALADLRVHWRRERPVSWPANLPYWRVLSKDSFTYIYYAFEKLLVHVIIITEKSTRTPRVSQRFLSQLNVGN